MGQQYHQISLEERGEIAELLMQGKSFRKIAATLDRAPSTISREIKENGSKEGYLSAYAHMKAQSRRWRGSILERDPGLRERVLSGLKSGLSPEQVSGRLKRENNGQSVISYETIYRFIFAQFKRTTNYAWRYYLKSLRCRRRSRHSNRKNLSSARFIKGREPLEKRPEAVNDRTRPGHWEADLFTCANRQPILVLLERCTRLVVACKLKSKSSEPIAKAMKEIFSCLPVQLRKTVTFDNGTEFAGHQALNEIGMSTYFCDPYSPWQKGSVEHAIRRLRGVFTHKTDLRKMSKAAFNRIINVHNNAPRKCLDYQTPSEVFFEQLLRFKCECCYSPSRV